MPPKGRPKKKVEVTEDKIAVNNVADDVIITKKIGEGEKSPIKAGSKKTKNIENGMNGSTEIEEQQAEVISEPDVPTNDKMASKRRQKPAKTKGKEVPAEDDINEEFSDLKEDEPKDLPAKRGRRAAGNIKGESSDLKEDEPKDLPAKRGRRAAEEIKENVSDLKDEPKDLPAKRGRKAAEEIKENVSDLKDEPKDLPAKRGRRAAEDIKGESSNLKEDEPKDLPAKRGRKAAKIANGNKEEETDAVVEKKDLPRSRRNGKADVELSNAVKEQNQPKPKETKAQAKKKAKEQVKENSEEKEVPAKGAGRKKKNIAEKTEPEKVEDEKSPEIDENRQLRVAIKRNRNLDEMAKQQRENEAEDFEEPKVKNVKGPAKGGKGKRAAKDTSEDSQPIKKAKEDSKSKGASKKEKEKIPDVTALDFSNDSKTKEGKPWNLKIATWNVNGLRAWQEKNGLSYLHHEKPDILCIQETKCSDDKLPPELANIEGYHCHWLAGDKEGYSGVGLLSKEKPISVQYGIDIEEHDTEGRVITAEYDEFYLVTSYIPNSGRGLIRLDYRQKWDKDFRAYIKKLDEKKPVVLCGDLNVAHEEIDLANPKNNKKTAGFTKEEREGFSTLLSEGFVDSFRHLYPEETGAYTFWTYMMNARAKNVGWRLDYFVISERFVDHLCDSVIRKDVYGSDHCPIALFLHV